MQIFEIDGYLRLRSDYMHDFFLGQGYSTCASGPTIPRRNYGLPPFPVPLDCPRRPTGRRRQRPPIGRSPATPAQLRDQEHRRRQPAPAARADAERDRQVRVHAQIDVLDNTIMGSTPDSLAGIPGYNRPPPMDRGRRRRRSPARRPLGFQYTTQDPPEVGQNGFISSIRAKRAWAEIDSEFGSLRFGRMPWHWGRGIFYNDGGCADCDVGTTVDRVMALTQLYGHQIAARLGPGRAGVRRRSS